MITLAFGIAAPLAFLALVGAIDIVNAAIAAGRLAARAIGDRLYARQREAEWRKFRAEKIAAAANGVAE